jgi:hypothetical protein
LAKAEQDSLGRLQQTLDTSSVNVATVASISQDSVKSLRMQGYRAVRGRRRRDLCVGK